MEKENRCLEYKEDSTKSYLKTVSAFANYRAGRIVFGVSDDYSIVPIADKKAFRESVENQINDSIKPQPNYAFFDNDDGTITLSVSKGMNPPYLYHGKAFKRNDTSTIECDDFELRALILLGKGLDYEELASQEQNLSFSLLEQKLKESMGLQSFSLDTLKTLELYGPDGGFNNAAYLLSDKNKGQGIDIAVFGDSENIIKERYTFEGESIIRQYFSAIEVFERYYSYEEIKGALRERRVLIPEEAFREAVANSIVHRRYDVRGNTKISMYPDRILICSPGGLPYGISEEQYIDGDFSVLRNPIIANVFHRLGIIEKFATGINRIKSHYAKSYSKPSFFLKENSVGVLLPLLKAELELNENERKIVESTEKGKAYSRAELERLANLGKSSMVRAINNLLEKGVLIKKGRSSKTVYIREK